MRHRSSIALAACFACLLPASILAEDWWVVLYEDGSQIRYVETLPLEVFESPSVLAIWLGSEQSPPRRTDLDELSTLEPAVGRSLRVSVPGWTEALVDEQVRAIAAPVTMWDEVSENLLPQFPLDSAGTAEISSSSGESWRVRLTGARVGSWWAEVGPSDGQIAVRVRPARDVIVNAVDEDGVALGSVQARLAEREALAGPWRQLATYRASHGELVLPKVLDRDIRATLTAPGRVVQSRDATLYDLPATWNLAVGRTLSGIVVDRDGHFVPDLDVAVASWIGDSTTRLVSRSQTTEMGSFLIQSLPAGPVVVVVSGEGWAASRRQADLTDESRHLDLWQVKRAASMEVKVTDPEGRPVAGATIDGELVRSATTDDAGLATVTGLDPGGVNELKASAQHYLPKRLKVIPPIPNHTTTSLRPGFAVSGIFADASGLPVPDALLRLEHENRTEDRSLGEDGYFELTLTPERDYVLEFASTTTRRLRLPVRGAAGEWLDLGEVRSEAGRVVLGQVVSALDLAPILGATVTAARSVGPMGDIERLRADLLLATTDAEGRFRLSGLGPEEATLRFEASGLARREVFVRPASPDGTRADEVVDLGLVQLSTGAEIRVATDVSERAPDDRWTARIDVGGRWLESDMLTAHVDSEGLARFEHVPAGSAVLSIVEGRELICERRLAIEDGALVEAECLPAAGNVSGVVTVGGEISGVGKLHWQPPTPETAGLILHHDLGFGERRSEAFGAGRPQVDVEVDPSGAFAGAAVGAGAWSVAFSSVDGWTTGTVEVEVPEADDVQVQIDLPSLALHGTVTDEDGTPVCRARVRESVTGMVTFTDCDGRFRLVGLSPGTRYVKATHEGLRSKSVERVVQPEQPTEMVHLVLRDEPPESVRLIVTDPDGQPIAGALVIVEEGPGTVQILTAGSDGTVPLVLEPPTPSAIRFAAFGGGAWHLGSWRDPADLFEQPPVLMIDGGGSLRVTSGTWSGMLAIQPMTTELGGWDVGLLLGRVGRTPWVTPTTPVLVTGLPPGTYRVRAGGEGVVAPGRTVAVETGEEAQVTLEEE